MSRTLLTADSDWEIENPMQDVRGFAAVDGAGQPAGTVIALVIDTDAALVSSIVLDSGDEVPALDITIGDRVVYLAGAIPGAATVPDVPETLHGALRDADVPPAAQDDFRAHHAANPTEAGYDAVAAAYRFGFAAGRDEAHADADAALHAGWPDAHPAERAAAHYAYGRAQQERPVFRP